MTRHYLQDQEGATAIEYGLIAGGIALAIAAVVLILGSKLAAFFNTLAASL